MKSEIILPENFKPVYEEIITLIKGKKNGAKVRNDAVVFLYWSIGKCLKNKLLKNKKEEEKRELIREISKRLTKKYGKAFDKLAVFRMIKFYEQFPVYKKVKILSRQLTWSHFVELLPVDDELKRNFYATMCRNENWSVRTLRERKKSMLYERSVISKKPKETIAKEISELRDKNKMSLDMFYRELYLLDFLKLKDTYSEKELENAILDELEKFILEMGSDFAFLARQKHFILDGKDYYMDLLFYHRTLRRLVLIELKLGDFEPEHKGQVELYLSWLNKYEKEEGGENPVALILCERKSQETIELLELDQGNIHVGQYVTRTPSKELLQEHLL